jgi:RHS repeat-associated protein
MTDQTGAIAETTDYYPFGEIRLDNPSTGSGQANAFTEQRKFIGQEYDADTGLNYLNARYYNSAIGRFTSQDPVALALGDEQQIKQITGQPQNVLLSDPQQLNLYSYARNNPLIYTDSGGKKAELVVVPITGIPGAHTFLRITAEQGADLSQYGSGPNYTIGGYMSEWWGGNLIAKINESGNLNAPESSYLALYPLAPPEGINVVQYDQKLLEAGANLAKSDLGKYVFTGQPISSHANSGNTSAQVIIDAGGTIPAMKNVYYGNNSFLGLRPVYFPLGAGNPIGTQSYTQQVQSAANNKIQSVLNSIASTLSQLTQVLAKTNGN